MYVVDSSKASTLHGVGMQTAYIANGDVTAATKLAGSETDTSRYFLTVEVAAAADAHAIVVIGDSITDGVGSRRSQPALAGCAGRTLQAARRSHRLPSSIPLSLAIGY